jgi:hypothetical protein
MEKRSRRRTRDLVTQAASQGLSQNEIGCARISMMARSTNAPCKGRIQMRKTNPSICSNLACNARPVHTDGSLSTESSISTYKLMSASPPRASKIARLQYVAKGQEATHQPHDVRCSLTRDDEPARPCRRGLLTALSPNVNP